MVGEVINFFSCIMVLHILTTSMIVLVFDFGVNKLTLKLVKLFLLNI
jgi:hypothetical protein